MAHATKDLNWAKELVASGCEYALFLRRFAVEASAAKGRDLLQTVTGTEWALKQENPFFHLRTFTGSNPYDSVQSAGDMELLLVETLMGKYEKVIVFTNMESDVLERYRLTNITTSDGDWWEIFQYLANHASLILAWVTEVEGGFGRELQYLAGNTIPVKAIVREDLREALPADHGF